MTKYSKPLIKALTILNNRPDGLTPAWFAKDMWEDSPAWRRSYNTGNGACRGKGMWLCAGGYLHRLERKGLVERELSFSVWIWYITKKGKDILNEKNR